MEINKDDKYIVNGGAILVLQQLIDKLSYKEGKPLEQVIQVIGPYKEPEAEAKEPELTVQ